MSNLFEQLFQAAGAIQFGQVQQPRPPCADGRKFYCFGPRGEPVFEIQALAVRTYPEDQIPPRKRP